MLTIGPAATWKFFKRRKCIHGTVCFAFGIFMVLMGWPIIGMMVECFGIVNLFGNFFGVILVALQQLPVIGSILNLPIVKRLIARFRGPILPTHRP